MKLLPPRPAISMADRADERIKHRPVLGSLINEYQQRE
jgi:hypothetical protein